MTAVSDLTSHVTNEAGNRFLETNWEPTGAEIDVAGLTVRGDLPEGLQGSFMRNGPNPMFEPIGEYHMFDGDGMIHEVAFDDGEVSYRNRWIRSKALEIEMREGKAVYPGLGDVLNYPAPEIVEEGGFARNPANTHIIRHSGKYYALWEGGLPTELTADLETVGTTDYDGAIPGFIPAMSAHPRLDPRTGEMLTFRYSPLAPYIQYYVIDPTGKVVHTVDIDLAEPIMMHDFLITEDYVVFLDSPIVLNISGDDGPIGAWKPENGSRLGVMPRMGTADDLTWYDIETGHVQHFWNAWQDGDRIELGGTRLASVDFGFEDSGNPNPDPVLAYPRRFWIDLKAGKAGEEQFDDMGGDFCRFNDDYNGVRNRYDYMAGFSRRAEYLGSFDTVVAYDAETGKRQVWDFGDDWEAGEPVFAPDPSGTNEDDGWVLCLANDRAATKSELAVFEPGRIDDGPVAVVEMPQRVSFGFHANWFPDA